MPKKDEDDDLLTDRRATLRGARDYFNARAAAGPGGGTMDSLADIAGDIAGAKLGQLAVLTRTETVSIDEKGVACQSLVQWGLTIGDKSAQGKANVFACLAEIAGMQP